MFIAKDICWLQNCIRAGLAAFAYEGESVGYIKKLEGLQNVDEVKMLRLICRVLLTLGRDLPEAEKLEFIRQNKEVFAGNKDLADYFVAVVAVGAGTALKIIDNYNISYELHDNNITRAILTKK